MGLVSLGGSGVYPRVCGGTGRRCSTAHACAGLSPRLRGNHDSTLTRYHCGRSIPASAGEPYYQAVPQPSFTVYPRVCGGTVKSCDGGNSCPGLSPRLRGNRLRLVGALRCRRSIPASAGEPDMERRAALSTAVYPRVCGGTIPSVKARDRHGGLSPRLRGNRLPRAFATLYAGSIPASAGEPTYVSMNITYAWVYPRVCGGTHGGIPSRQIKSGLSPRLRGNRRDHSWYQCPPWSIPASAGEPRHHKILPCSIPVYPRVCGGTGYSPL